MRLTEREAKFLADCVKSAREKVSIDLVMEITHKDPKKTRESVRKLQLVEAVCNSMLAYFDMKGIDDGE